MLTNSTKHGKMTDNNLSKKAKLLRIIEETLELCLKKGFYGCANFLVKIHDGSIQDVEHQVAQKHK